MAAVWAARLRGSRGFQRLVAIKTILPDLVDDPAFEQMFLDEAELAARVQHPHVAQILDLGEQDGVLYLVMEWVEGESLSILQKASLKLTEKPVPLPIAARIVMQAAAGLHAAHELRDEDGELIGLVHRDVSPQNILLSYKGSVKIVDFGIAKAMGRGSAETMAGKLKGKVPYMSPEQAIGEPIDRRTDVFALGTVFYQLALGKHPFRGESDVETMNNILSRPVLPPRAIEPSFPEELEEVVMKAIAKDKDERFPTMAAFEAALGAAIARLGMLTSDGDVEAFVEKVLGERAKRRRDALKEAMRAADEQATGFRDSSFTLSSAVTQSGLSLAPRTLPEAPPHSGLSLAPLPAPSSSTRLATPPSLVGVAHEADTTSSTKRAVVPLAIAAALAIGFGAFALLRKDPAAASDAMPAAATEPVSKPASLPVEEDPAPAELPADPAPAASAVEVLEIVEAEEVEEAEDFTEKALPASPEPARKAVSKKREATPSPVEKRPLPKRKKVPEIQDPGF